MANAALSNRQRKNLKKTTPAVPRTPRGDATVKVAPPKKHVEPQDRDGLAWLAKKGWITPQQAMRGFHYRDLVRSVLPGSLKVADLEGVGGGGAGGGGLPFGGNFGDAAAQLELFVIRNFILGNEEDLVLVMDGVCGRAHTVRYLAGGNQYRSHELLAALRIALNLLIASDEAKRSANGGVANRVKAA